MNILMVFPRFEYLELLEQAALQRFLHSCERMINSAIEGKHKLFFLAENDTARKLREDNPSVRFISITNELDRDVVALCKDLEDCVYDEAELHPANYSVKTKSKNFTSLEAFSDYYQENIQKAYEELYKSMNVIIEYSMQKKFMRVKTKNIPISCIFYDINIQTGKDILYIAGNPNEQLRELWKGGIPNANKDI